MSGRPRRLIRIGGAAVVLAASIGAAGAFVALRDRADAPATEVATPAVPTLLAATDLRPGPANDLAPVQRLAAGTVVQLIGRSADGQWLAVSPAGQDMVVGWVPVAVVGGAGAIDALAVVAPSGASGTASPTGPAGAATAVVPGGADRPDLALERVFSRDNRLGVTIANRGTVDVTARILVSVDGRTAEPVPVKAGEPLRADDTVDFVFPDEYVQRRAQVHVAVSTDPPVAERDAANNAVDAVIAPDLPNDLEIVSAASAVASGELRVVIRNNSPIPVVGAVTLTVQASGGSDRSLGARTADIDLAPQASTTLALPDVQHVDFTKATVLLVTEAINDAVPTNDVYPR